MEHPITVYITADALISSLGKDTQENMAAIRAYRSGISRCEAGLVSDGPIVAATIVPELFTIPEGTEENTRLEQLFIHTIRAVISQSGISLACKECALILSTTKGNVDALSTTHKLAPEVHLWKMGQRIGQYFDASNPVEVISNACISGVSALIVAKRWIETGKYKQVIVAGGDILSHFITSGFLSFKSISIERCRPYDARRDGLNLGEACGAVLLSAQGDDTSIILSGGAISNDANHISGPSRTGDGLYLAIRQAMKEATVTAQEISFVNAHGTATAYNDEMESKAIRLAGLEEVPVNSLKPYLGHTLGASGVIESILCIHQLKENIAFGTLGYEEPGVSVPLLVQSKHRDIPMKHCLKTASGFGGCNAAIVLTLPAHYTLPSAPSAPHPVHTSTTVVIENSGIRLNGETVFTSPTPDFALFVREAYKKIGGSAMKFYKMDDLCKLGYIAAEYLLKERNFQPEEIGIVLANSASSLDTDIRHHSIITQEGDCAASPALFVYTLPNVVAGEICIRHKIQGENTFFIDKEFDADKLEQYARIVMEKGSLKACIMGWCDLLMGQYKADFKLIEVQ